MLLTRSSRLATLIIAVVLFAVLSSLASDCQAQRRFVLGQEVNRFLGLWHGPGFHCNTPGQNTDYYNPYSAHNSVLTYHNDPYNRYPGIRGFDSETVPHASYTSRGKDQHSVFESAPGQTVQPRFEPAVDRTKKKPQEADFDADSELDFDADEDLGASSTSDFDPSILDELEDLDTEVLAGEGDGDFESLKNAFEDLQGDGSSSKGSGVGEGFLD